jgi:RimJ/RimL family protein N-acetyltransferase
MRDKFAILEQMDKSVYLLRTDRLGLRLWKASDVEVFAGINTDPAVMEYFPRPWTAAESAAMVEKIGEFFGENGFGLYAVDVMASDEFIGYVGMTRPSFEAWFTPCVEIGWRLRREAWGFGYATEAAAECLRFGLEDLRLPRIYSFTAVPNKPSERVMQKIGMRFVEEFEHPKIEEGNWLRRHVLYEAERGTEFASLPV